LSDLDVDVLKQRILSCAVEHWRADFTGISSSAIAKRLTVPHNIVLEILDELERHEMGSVTRDVGLPQLAPSPSGPVSSASKAITTSIFFPSPRVLTERFYADNLDRKGIPEYKVRLHKGYSQIHLVYFDPEVLRRYRDHPDTYDIGDSVSGGHLFLSPDRTPPVRREDQVDDVFPVITFGRRHLANGKELISVILYDLSELPVKEQAHWRSYEADDPKFATVDPDFANFLKRDFDAEWVEDNDPLRLVWKKSRERIR
jgi:hypothetical protein